MNLRKAALLVPVLVCGALAHADDTDPYLWLEDVDSARSMEWVKQQNAVSQAELQAHPGFAGMHQRLLEIIESKDRIPSIRFQGDKVYNFWQDDRHQRGVWRRTTLASYRTVTPVWETVLDLDQLAKQENKPWAWKGAKCLEPRFRRCLLSLSRGGGDAVEVREFDTTTKRFVKGGFQLPEAKTSIDWFDANTLWVGTNFGPGSLTDSGYARIVKLWSRGTTLSQARTVFEGNVRDVSVSGTTSRVVASGRQYHLVERSPAFFKSDYFLYLESRVVKLDLPPDARLRGIFDDRLLLTLRSDWTPAGTTYAQGSLIAIRIDDFLAGSRHFDTLFAPGERVSLAALTYTDKRLFLATLDNVRSRLYQLTYTGREWTRRELTLPGTGSLTLGAIDAERDRLTYTYSDFVTPSAYFIDDAGQTDRLRMAPAFFDASGIKVAQQEAVSKDGTRIPYFLVTPKNFIADGTAPTVMYGYGGFEISQLPRYNAASGANWLEKGGVYVVANIRGGGEFGPRWHQAAKGHQRMKNFEDFIAIAEDLIARKITSPRRLGISGGSQGGLLVGATFALRPDLFNAVVAAVPLADMKRFHKLLAGASWMGEYGNPDKAEDWAVIKTYSPYELLNKDARYPKVFYWTTTRDDRVHPAHARKMVAKMKDMGHPVLYFENIEGGHGSGTTSKQQALVQAMQWAYFWQQLR